MYDLFDINRIKSIAKESVIGQDELIDKILITVYRHLFRINHNLVNSPSNLLIQGHTGCGKTFAVKVIADLLNLPFVEINAKSICQEGWNGQSFKQLVHEKLHSLTIKKEYAAPIIFIDEFDKICTPNSSDKFDNVNLQLQYSLLKYIEGMEMSVNGVKYFTDKCCFIFAGAFTELKLKEDTNIGFTSHSTELLQLSLTEALINFGLIPEFAGRIGRYVQIKPFTQEFFRDLICNKNFICNQWFAKLVEQQIPYETPNYSAIINEAINLKLGVRGLIQLIEPYIDNAILNHTPTIAKRPPYVV